MDTNAVNAVVLDEMINNLSNLASVYYKTVSLVSRASNMPAGQDDEDGEPERPIQAVVQEAAKALGGDVGNLLDLDFGTSYSEKSTNADVTHDKRGSTIDEMLGSVDTESLSIPFPLSDSPTTGVMSNSYSLIPGFSFSKTIFLSSSDCNGLSLTV